MIDAYEYRGRPQDGTYQTLSPLGGNRNSPSGGGYGAYPGAYSYATLTPLQPVTPPAPPIALEDFGFVSSESYNNNVSGSFTVMQANGISNLHVDQSFPYAYKITPMSQPPGGSPFYPCDNNGNAVAPGGSQHHHTQQHHPYHGGLPPGALPPGALPPSHGYGPRSGSPKAAGAAHGAYVPVQLYGNAPQAQGGYCGPTASPDAYGDMACIHNRGAVTVKSEHLPVIHHYSSVRDSSATPPSPEPGLAASSGPPAPPAAATQASATTVVVVKSEPASGASATAAGAVARCAHQEPDEIDTKALATAISAELKRYSIPQAIFAQRVLCRSQGTLSDLLRNPKPWPKLKSGRETFRRMWNWLKEPEDKRMTQLRLAAAQIPQRSSCKNKNVRFNPYSRPISIEAGQ